MKGVTIVDHPLVQHKLTLMRRKDTSTKGFRQLLKEIGGLICYEVTRDLALETVEIETPMAVMSAPQLAGKKLVFAAILRSGVGMLDGMLALVPAVILTSSLNSQNAGIGTDFGGISLLIAVGVALETMKQIDGQLMMRNYEGFLKL